MKSPTSTGMLLAAGFALAGCAATPPKLTQSEAQRQVEATERAFAKSMADRDQAAFEKFLADETVFFSGKEALRGKARVVASWKRYFDPGPAPFSWEPAQVEVLESGTLALSTGPVRDPSGKTISIFNSIWRREASGEWRIVFDKACRVCADGK